MFGALTPGFRRLDTRGYRSSRDKERFCVIQEVQTNPSVDTSFAWWLESASVEVLESLLHPLSLGAV